MTLGTSLYAYACPGDVFLEKEGQFAISAVRNNRSFVIDAPPPQKPGQTIVLQCPPTMSITCIKSDDFWFEDGDVVLCITEDDVEHQFCIHRLILTIASPVFRDMFSMPHPVAVGSERLAVPLRGDSVQDLTALLGALYAGRKAQVVTFDVALAVLQLSHKYQIEGLRQAIKLKLLEDWPLNRSEYLARLAFLGSPGYRVLQASRLVETAQLCQARELLPAKFYELACAWRKGWLEIIPNLSSENLERLWAEQARVEQRLRSFSDWTSEPSPMWKSASVDGSITIFQYRKEFGDCMSEKPMNEMRTSKNTLFPVHPLAKTEPR